MTTATLSRPRILLAPGPTRRGLLLGFFGTLAVGVSLLVGLSIGVATTHDGLIMPGVSAGAVKLGGLDRASAEARLRAELPSLGTGRATVMVDGTSFTVSYDELGRDYQFDAILDAAFGAARSGNPLTDGLGRLRSLFGTNSVPVSLHAFDEAAMNRIASDLAARFSHSAVDAEVRLEPGHGFVATAARPGARLEPATVRDALGAALATADPSNVTVAISSIPIQPAITDHQAAAAVLAAQRMTAAPLRLDIPGPDDPTFGVAALRRLVRFGADGTGEYAALIAEPRLREAVSTLADRVARKPLDASFTFDAYGVAGVVPAQTGRQLDLKRGVAAVREALARRASGRSVAAVGLATKTAQPALSTAQAQAAAPRMQQISTWTTYYIPGEGNYWGANISIPAQDVDGLVLAPGEWFNFWNDIGPITVERGYGYGGAIIGGRSVANGALAGGICSTSTTLFNAAMRAGLQIGDRTNHYYYIDRYPTGLDATVFKTETYEVNMTFRNDMANPIVIRSYTGTGFVRFDIWGIPDGRTVTLSAPTTSNYRTARDTTVVNNSLDPGTAIRVEYPHNGFDAVVTRWVRDADGNLIWQNTWTSHYSAVNGITEVGPARTSSEPPADQG
jgi:vancomycin resistance protein YoaR